MTAPIRIRVELGERSYDVLVGPGVRHRLAAELAACMPATPRRVVVVTSDGIGVDTDVGEVVGAVETLTIPSGERSKSLATVEDLCRRFARFGLTRGDAVVAVGGGLVTDVAGFAAAVYHRGTPVVFVPTTLLGQIDAAIGGKTGVNLPEGKNLVGAFWQPSLVLCDSEVLATLPAAEYRSGLGEMAKYHFLAGDDSGPGAAAMAELPLEQRIARCVRLKAEIVASDERESGRRMLLNYGHTLAHALEIAGGFGLRHGEAVAVGLVYAAEVARRLGRIDGDRVAEHRQVVSAYGLPASLPAGTEAGELIDLFGRDKKAVGELTLVLDGPRGLEPVRGVDRVALAEALEAIR
ncbi:MAG: 3-dehydroquinate synthase [bacterium]|nr:3-dehydroquinate synthase [bacterium]